jgi:hypothetical protein
VLAARGVGLATERADRKLRETGEECTRRVNDATHQVQDLQSLRKRIHDQLTSVHSLMRDASPLLEPQEDERHRATGSKPNPANATTTPLSPTGSVPAGSVPASGVPASGVPASGVPAANGAKPPVKPGVPVQRQQPATAGAPKGRKG